MSRRIDIELTSALADGSWTWRAAGARVPKGVLDGTILPEGATVGDELKVEVEQELDGIEVVGVVKGREKSSRDLLELLPVEEDFQAVIETRARRDRGERGGRDDRRGRGRDRDRGPRGDRDRGPRGDRDRGPRGDRDRDGRRGAGGDGRDGGDGRRRQRRPHFDPPPEVPQRPKPKRLRPGKAHRQEVLASVPEAQRPIAELAVQGMAAVRTRLTEENRRLADAGEPTMPTDGVLSMAEGLIPKLRVADWLDRAEAARRQMEQLDLRDLRSVVAASDDPIVARDESTRELAEQLKADLVTKQDQELRLWLDDVSAAIDVGRSIRALRLSSQPPKAGVMFPPELARRLGEAATAGLTADDPPDRWAAVMEAAAFSPVRALVVPTAPPATVTDELRATALRLGPLLPQIATLLGVEVPADAPRPKPLRPGPRQKGAERKRTAGRRDDATRGGRDRGGRDGGGRDRGRRDGAPGDAAPTAETPSAEPSASEAPSPETTSTEAPATETPAVETGPAETPTTESPTAEPSSAEEGGAVSEPTTPGADPGASADAAPPAAAPPDVEPTSAEAPGSAADEQPTPGEHEQALGTDARQDPPAGDDPTTS